MNKCDKKWKEKEEILTGIKNGQHLSSASDCDRIVYNALNYF